MVFPSASQNPLRSRADLEQLVRDLVAPLRSCFTPGGAGIRLGAGVGWYGESASLLEGLLRPLWGLVPLGAGGAAFPDWELWRKAIRHGTDPKDPEFWGWPGDRDQRLVESAALGFGLNLLPSELWDAFDDATRQRLGDWLDRMLHVAAVDNNWLFFQVMVSLGLRRCRRPHAQDLIESNLDRIESFYLDSGWYADGATGHDGKRGDYYGPMALHYYGLIYAATAGGLDPQRALRYRARAAAYAPAFMHWFDAEGAALPFGRSLTYRFAQGAFWGALAFADVEALPWGVIKGLYLRHLRWWMRQPIFSETGLLSIGYTYPNTIMAESYNGPGSPYWGMKAFLPLALPENHPFWRAAEAPLPARPAVAAFPQARQILLTPPGAPEIIALNASQVLGVWPRHAAHKYSKFAYSTRFGFCVPVGRPSLEEGGFDSMLALSDDGGGHFRGRESVEEVRVEQDTAFSRWFPWPDVEVETWLVATATAHGRVHRLRTVRPLLTVESGFATGATRLDAFRASTAYSAEARVQSPAGFTAIRDLSCGRTAGHVILGVNSHLLHPLAAMPFLQGELSPGVHWLACVVWGGATERDEAEWRFVGGRADRFTLKCDGTPLGVSAMHVGQ